MVLELGKAASFFASLLSLCALLDGAFFVPGTTWQDRLVASLARIALAACICFASGLLFREEAALRAPESHTPLIATLPVRLFFWSLLVMALLFALSWYLQTFYLP